MSTDYNPVSCSTADCGRPSHARGLCTKHYQRFRKHGSIDDPQAEPARFWSKVNKHGGIPQNPYRPVVGECWLWTAYKNPAGYGQFGVTGGGLMLAPRWSYADRQGPIADGMTIDHLCRVRACVNPDHLELVSGPENTRRANEVRDYGPPMAICGNGHLMTPENTYPKRGPGRRNSVACKECHRTRSREYQARRRANR